MASTAPTLELLKSSPTANLALNSTPTFDPFASPRMAKLQHRARNALLPVGVFSRVREIYYNRLNQSLIFIFSPLLHSGECEEHCKRAYSRFGANSGHKYLQDGVVGGRWWEEAKNPRHNALRRFEYQFHSLSTGPVWSCS